jgi:hypothetical protein
MGFSKRGVGPKFFVGLVIAIAGFVIVLFFIGKFGFQDLGVDEVCKFSVLSRATTPAGKNLVPLKCTTDKICLTKGLFGKCEQFAGEENVVKVKLSGDDRDVAAKIEEVSAKAMYDCWQMMGQGKLDLSSDKEIWEFFAPGSVIDAVDFFRNKNIEPTCVICSRVALDKDFVFKKDRDGKFSDELTDEFERVSELVDINGYLERTPAPSGSGLSYLQEFTDRQVVGYPRGFRDEIDMSQGVIKSGVVDETAILFMQLISNDDPTEQKQIFDGARAVEAAVLTGAVVVGSAILTPVGGVLILKGGLLAMATAGGTAGVLSAHDANQKKSISSLYCGEVSTARELKANDKLYGCSMVKSFDYDNIADINRNCKNIEGSL